MGAAAVAFSVITFGAGTAVVAAAVITTGALGGAAIFYSNKADDCRQAPHECDSTKGGTWELFHRKVYIEKAKCSFGTFFPYLSKRRDCLFSDES